jgi:hypothetical protein
MLEGVNIWSSPTGNPNPRSFAACAGGGCALPLVSTR